MTDHLGYEQHAAEGQGSGNSRNGAGKKTLRTDHGPVTVDVPRDRNGSFEPKLVKHQRSFKGFDDEILSMHARGMSVRDIQAHLHDEYRTEVSPDLISRVTDAVIDEIQFWQARPLDPVWPIFYLDALVIKVRDQGVVQNKSAYIALGMGVDGSKEVLGISLESTEGAKFWLKVITELKNRGVHVTHPNRNHEMAHTDQHTLLGPAYIPAQLAAQGASWILTGTYDDANPLEWGPNQKPRTPWGWP